MQNIENLFNLFVYRQIYVSFLALFFVILFFLFWIYIYPKKKPNFLFFLIVISFLPCISILRKGIFESGDMNVGATYAMAFYKNLEDGIFVPRWAGILNAGYGYALFDFNYLLPYYFTSLFHFFGLGFVNSVKLLFISTYVISGVLFYKWASKELSEKAAFVSSIFYLYAPYHLITMNFRGATGEMLAFAVIPLVLICLKNYKDSNYPKKWFMWSSICLSLLILSHPAITLLSFPWLFIYTFYFKEKNGFVFKFFHSIKPFILGIILSTFYWLPALYETKYTNTGITSQTINFPSIWTYIYSPYRLGFLFQGHYGELATIVGYIQLIVIALIISYVFKNKLNTKLRKFAIFYLICFFVYFLIMQKPFSFLYGTIPLLGRIQFPYRLLSLITLFTAFMSGILVMATKRKHQKLLIISLVILAAIPTILNWSNRGFVSNVNDDYLMKVLKERPSDLPALDTAAPKWFPEGNFWQKEPAENNLEIVSGKGDIVEIKRKTNDHEYIVNAQTDISLRENTYYFPGWELTVNNVPKGINYLNPKLLGIISFDLKKGLYSVKLKFIDTPVKKVSNTISLLGILLLVLYASGIITKWKINIKKLK